VFETVTAYFLTMAYRIQVALRVFETVSAHLCTMAYRIQVALGVFETDITFFQIFKLDPRCQWRCKQMVSVVYDIAREKYGGHIAYSSS
jgi:hypothetical protein